MARREWGALTGGPLSATWWVTKTGFRTTFAEVMFIILVLLNSNTDTLSAAASGEVSMLPLATPILIMPGYLTIVGIVFAVTLLLPFLPRRNEVTNRWE